MQSCPHGRSVRVNTSAISSAGGYQCYPFPGLNILPVLRRLHREMCRMKGSCESNTVREANVLVLRIYIPKFIETASGCLRRESNSLANTVTGKSGLTAIFLLTSLNVPPLYVCMYVFSTMPMECGSSWARDQTCTTAATQATVMTSSDP